MGQGGVFEIGDDLFHDRVPAVLGLGSDQFVGGVGETGVIAPRGEQLTLLTVEVFVPDAAHDQPCGDGMFVVRLLNAV